MNDEGEQNSERKEAHTNMHIKRVRDRVLIICGFISDAGHITGHFSCCLHMNMIGAHSNIALVEKTFTKDT